MIGKNRLEIITHIAILAFIGIFLYVKRGNHEFSGTNDVASGIVPQLTGTPIESFTLFALQAACGVLIFGSIFRFWLGQRRSKPVN